ncbi:tetratricopeptide repeat protein [bacterium]|nr:tetratricopeptide repeat protein [candidate division CSSED10-310 bacterium]
MKILLWITGCIVFGVFPCLSSQDDRDSTTESLPNIDTLWNFSDPSASESNFRAVLSKVPASGATSYHIELLTQIARAEGLQGNFQEGHKTLDQAEKMLLPEHKRAKVRYLLERGRLFNSSGDPIKSRAYFLEAWNNAQSEQFGLLAIDAAHMLGIVEEPVKQLEWNIKALKLAESSDNPRAKNWLGPMYNNIGWTYFDMNQFDKALELFNKSLEWRMSRKDDEGTRIAKWTIARVYRELNRIDEAMQILQDLEKETHENNLPASGYVHEEMGECYLIKGDPEAAKEHFKTAYKILSADDWLTKNEPERLQRIKSLGGID